MQKLGKRSLASLEGCHPDLVKLMHEAVKYCPIDFTIYDGKRTLAQQRKHVANGKSKTLRSRHLSGKAIDLMALAEDTWNPKHYVIIAAHIKAVAKRLGIPITWGGDWKSFRDYVHFELDKNKYGY